ncbi:MAG: hypothetical protein L0221_09385 [Chloroflexi bacterium]|nr:hypothetical protein [Chloroflexota bacterium]
MTAGPVAASTPDVSASLDTDVALVADLEGLPIPLVAVGKFHCNDVDFPAIHCFRSAAALSASVDIELSLSLQSASDYVQIYQDAGFGGPSMIVSQNYSVLATIGWNDRISSFRGKNFQTGTFFTDWFAGGTPYGFCCNQQVSSLGGFNDTFSSVYNN